MTARWSWSVTPAQFAAAIRKAHPQGQCCCKSSDAGSGQPDAGKSRRALNGVGRSLEKPRLLPGLFLWPSPSRDAGAADRGGASRSCTTKDSEPSRSQISPVHCKGPVACTSRLPYARRLLLPHCFVTAAFPATAAHVELQGGRSYMDSYATNTVFVEGVFRRAPHRRHPLAAGRRMCRWAGSNGRDVARYQYSHPTTRRDVWLLAGGARFQYGEARDWYRRSVLQLPACGDQRSYPGAEQRLRIRQLAGLAGQAFQLPDPPHLQCQPAPAQSRRDHGAGRYGFRLRSPPSEKKKRAAALGRAP